MDRVYLQSLIRMAFELTVRQATAFTDETS